MKHKTYLLLLLLFSNTFVHATVYNGTCGTNLTWTLDSGTGELEISGTGPMTNWASVSDVPWDAQQNYISTVIINDGVSSIGNRAFGGYAAITSITISSSVTRIGDYALGVCKGLTSISLPDGLLSIGQGALNGCSGLTSITIPSSVSSIGSSAFRDCSGLASVFIQSDIINIEEYTFYNCYGLASIAIPNSVQTIGNYAFYNCDYLTAVIIPNSVTSIGDYVFQNCDRLASVSMGNGIISIGTSAFASCNNLSSVNISDISSWCNIAFGDLYSNPLEIAGHLFLNSVEVSNLSVPIGVVKIKAYAFAGCISLESITIPNGVTHIGERAFDNCSELTSIIIPNGVTEINERAFRNCKKLTSFTCYSTNPPTLSGSSHFFQVPSGATLYVPNDCTTSYAEATGWSRFSGHISGIATQSVVIGSTGWATFSSNTPLDLAYLTASTGDAAAYYASNASGSVVTLTETYATVPAGEGLLLKGTNGATISIPVTSSGTSIDGNKLVGCPSGATITPATPNYANIYVLAADGSTAQFENIKDYVDANISLFLGAGKAYLNLEGITLAPGALRIELEEDTATKLEALLELDKAVKFIENGNLLIKRDGIIYDTLGRIIR